jgi:hypothetical protein
MGAEKIIEWCKLRHLQLKDYEYLCFGDSQSDLEMADYLYSKNLKTEFIYVGSNNEMEKKYPIHLTKEKYTAGTLEYLQNIKID